MITDRTKILDQAGVAASFACAVHCVAMPLVLGYLAGYGTVLLTAPWLEWIAVATSFILGLVSLLPSYRKRHRQKRCLAIFLVGITVIVAARFFNESSGGRELAAVCSGAVLISTAHLLNRKLCRSCTGCHK